MPRIGLAAGQPVKHYQRVAPKCSRGGCRRNEHVKGLCRQHADEAEQGQFAVIDRYIREARADNE